jgi:hypothetical protein
MQVNIIEPSDGKPVRVVRRNKPRNGKGVTLAEFTNRTGTGVEDALSWACKKGHTPWKGTKKK